MKRNKLTRWAAGVLALAAASTAPRAAQRLTPIHAVCLPVRPLPLVSGLKHGTFVSHGIELHAEVAPDSDYLRAGLAAGKFEVAHALVDNAVALAESGAADALIVMGGEHALTELIAQPGIHSVEELRGRTLLVDAPSTGYALQLKKILLASGLRPGRDCELKAAGSTPQRLAAMREHKEYAATLLAPPSSVVARHEGFVSLGAAQKWVGPYQGAGVFVRRDWAQGHSELLAQYLAACIEEQRWLLSPAHKQQVLDLLMSESHLSAEVAAETYALMVESRAGYEEDARLDLDGFRTTLQLRAEMEGTWGGRVPDPARYYDPSYYRRALSKMSAHE